MCIRDRLRDDLYVAFNGFREKHPWVDQENVKPKSVARELYERVMTFGEYVSEYGMKRSEGLVLRYLTDCYRAMVQTVPDSEKTDEVVDLIEWLGEMVRQVDSSLIDEWERMINPEEDDSPAQDSRFASIEAAPRDVTSNSRAFSVMIRNEAFRWVQLLSRRSSDELSRVSDPDHALDIERAPTRLRSVDQVEKMVAAYFEEQSEVATGPDARAPEMFQLDVPIATPAADTDGERIGVRQVVVDPEGFNEWALLGWVDVDRSKAAGRAVLVFDELRRQT